MKHRDYQKLDALNFADWSCQIVPLLNLPTSFTIQILC